MNARQRAEFASEVRQERAARGLSQRQLAELAGIAPNTLSRIENEKDVQIGNVGRVRRALDLEPLTEAVARQETPQNVEAMVDFVRLRLGAMPHEQFMEASAELVKLLLGYGGPDNN